MVVLFSSQSSAEIKAKSDEVKTNRKPIIVFFFKDFYTVFDLVLLSTIFV